MKKIIYSLFCILIVTINISCANNYEILNNLSKQLINENTEINTINNKININTTKINDLNNSAESIDTINDFIDKAIN